MARQKKEEIVKAKDQILALSDDDAESLYNWFEMLLEVREQEKERKLKALTV